QEGRRRHRHRGDERQGHLGLRRRRTLLVRSRTRWRGLNRRGTERRKGRPEHEFRPPLRSSDQMTVGLHPASHVVQVVGGRELAHLLRNGAVDRREYLPEQIESTLVAGAPGKCEFFTHTLREQTDGEETLQRHERTDGQRGIPTRQKVAGEVTHLLVHLEGRDHLVPVLVELLAGGRPHVFLHLQRRAVDGRL